MTYEAFIAARQHIFLRHGEIRDVTTYIFVIVVITREISIYYQISLQNKMSARLIQNFTL